MATNVVLNGSTYSIPAVGDSNWGTNLSNFFIAIGSGVLQKTGGSFTLTSEIDFGATYGLKSLYYKSRATNPSATGIVRLGNTEGVSWRNAANNADLALSVNASNALQFNGVSLTISGLIVNADVASGAAIAYSKLNLATSIVNADISASAAIAISKIGATTASRALVTDGSGLIVAATTTATEIGFVNGLTSSAQTQLNSKISNTLTTATGDMIYASAPNVPARLPVGSSNQVIKSVGGVPVWSAAPSGGVNYLSAGTDGDSIASWVTYADAAASTPVDGTGGSPASTFAVSTDSSLRGTTNFLWTHSAANRQGEGFSTNFTIDPSDKGKVLQCSFEYLVASGTYADDDLQFWIYDVTNAQLIQPAPYKLKNSGIIEKFAMEFQTSSSSTSYRLIGHVATATATATAYTIRFDNWNLGPQAKLYGSPITDWVAWTPTGSWSTNTTYSGFKRRVGDVAQYKVKVLLAGAPTSAILSINQPAGEVIDTAKIQSISSTANKIGFGNSLDSGTNNYDLGVWYNSTTSVQPYALNASATYTAGANVTQAVPITYAINDEINLEWSVPIAGWSSSVVMSSDANTNVVAAKYTTTNTDSLTTATFTMIDFGVKSFDTHASVSGAGGGNNTTPGSGWKFTVPVSGKYQISAGMGVTSGGGWAAGESIILSLYKNGSENTRMNRVFSQAAHSQAMLVTGTTSVDCVAGDTLQVGFYQDSGAGLGMNGSGQYVDISRLSGPAQIAASETVAANYSGIPTGTINNSANTATYPTKVRDTHSAYSGGTYTVPSSGSYSINASFSATAGTITEGNYLAISIYKNGVGIASKLVRGVMTGGNGSQTADVKIEGYPLLAGDLITIKSQTTYTTPAYGTLLEASEHHFNIIRTGNF